MIDGSIRVCLESFGVWMKDTIGTPKKKIQIIIEFQLIIVRLKHQLIFGISKD